MLRILFSHFNASEYNLFKTAIHEISTELTVSQVECGDGLFNLLKYTTPDILFLNVFLPDKEPTGCLQKLRAQPKYNALPIIVYSSAADSRYVNEYYFSDRNYYIKKPYSFESLCRILEHVLTADMNTAQPHLQKRLLIKSVFNA